MLVRPLPLAVPALAIAAVLALAGCSSDGEPATTPAAPVSAGASSVATAEPDPTPEAPEPAVVATAHAQAVDVFADPADAEPVRTVEAAEVVSVPDAIPLTFLVVEERDDWVHVHLPVRPNGSTGWVRADDVTLTTTDYRVEVRLAEHRLLLHRGAEVVLDVPVGIGREDVPTPGGVYYVKELLQPPTPGGPYGAYAYGLSGYSPVLEQFAGGAGVIGIHGTNDPASIGTDASHGCIRMHDADVTRLVEEFGLPLGTPVEIVA